MDAEKIRLEKDIEDLTTKKNDMLEKLDLLNRRFEKEEIEK